MCLDRTDSYFEIAIYLLPENLLVESFTNISLHVSISASLEYKNASTCSIDWILWWKLAGAHEAMHLGALRYLQHCFTGTLLYVTSSLYQKYTISCSAHKLQDAKDGIIYNSVCHSSHSNSGTTWARNK